MLEVVVLLILILIIIFIIYTYFYLQEEEPEIISNNKTSLVKNKGEKIISYYSEYLHNKNNGSYVIYYDLPKNCIYWTIGFYNDGKCITSVNMGKYQTIESGDILAIIVGSNYRAMKSAKKQINNEHRNKYPYRKLISHYLGIKSDFYIHFESYSNRFLQSPKISIKEYIFNKIQFEEFKNEELPISIPRQCERIDFFTKSKEEFINNRCEKINVYIDTNEENVSSECLTNKSDIIDVSNTVYKKDKDNNDILNEPIPQFKLVAVDHFKSRAALHSHVVFYNADNNEPFDVEITGEVSDSFNQKESISTRRILFIIPSEIKRMYVIEYIYFDFVSGNKINPKTIIPFEIYKIK